MRINSFFQALTAFVGLATIVNALLQPGASVEELTNGERIARGLGPFKPARLYDPTRTNVLRPRSSTPPGIATFSVAAGPADPGPVRKRDNGVPGFFSISNGVLRFADTQAEAAVFFYPDLSQATTLGAIVGGQPLDVYAVRMGPIYGVRRYNGDLNPFFPPPGSSIPQEGLWVRGSNGNVFLAPDLPSALWFDSGATVLHVQTFITNGGQPSLSAATAQQQENLRNAIKLYVKNAVGDLTGWLFFPSGSNNLLAPSNSRTYAKDFFRPNAQNPGADQTLYTTRQGKTAVGTLIPSTTGSYFQFLDVATANSANILSFFIPESGNGRVSISSGGTTFSLFHTLQGGAPDNFRFLLCSGSDAASCNSPGQDIQPLCIEAVTGNAVPSVCDAWLRDQLAMNYVRRSSLYFYDPTGKVGSGYLLQGFNFYQLVQDQTSAVQIYFPRSASGPGAQPLYSITAEPRVNSFGTGFVGTGLPIVFNASAPRTRNEAQWNIPADRSTTELTILRNVNGQPTNQPLSFDQQNNWIGLCETPEQCPADGTAVRVCSELVPAGESPQLCVPGWQPA